MKFTASLANDTDPAAVLDCADRIDDTGYDTLCVGDERLNRNPYALLAMVAERTERVDVGTAVTNPYTRHPAMTAAAIATIDELADGRAQLGLGAGSPIVLDPLGYDQSDPLGTLRDGVRAIRTLLDGDEASIEREEFAVDGASLDVTPSGDVPVYVAGRGPGILGLGGYRGDGVLAGAGLASVAGMEYAFEKVRDGAAKAGRSLDDVDVVCWAFLSMAEDRAVALDGVNHLVASIVNKTPMPALQAIGVAEDDAAAVKAVDDVDALSDDELREVVPRSVTEQFAVAGTPAECRDHVARLREAGVDHVGTLAFDNAEQDAVDAIEWFSETVIDEV